MPTPNIISKKTYRRVTKCFLFALLGFSLKGLLASDPKPEELADPGTVHIGGLSQLLFDHTSNDIIIATEIFFKEIAVQLGIDKTKLTIYQSTDEMINSMQKGELDTIFVNPIDYLDLDSLVHSQYRYTLSFGDKTEQRVRFITRSSESISHLSQLHGKRLSIPKGYLLGKVYLEVVLAEAGLQPPNEFFSSIHLSKNTNESLLDVFFNKTDLAVTSDLAYELAKELNPQIENNTDILITSPPYIPFIIGVNKQVPENTLVDLDAILMEVNSKPRIRQLLSLFSANDLVRVKPEHLDELIKLRKKHQKITEFQHHH